MNLAVSYLQIKQEQNIYELTIDSAKLMDTGDYSCFAENGGDQSCRSSKAGFLKVVEDGIKPHEFLEKRKYETKLSEDVELICSALADPEPTVQWFEYVDDKFTEVVGTDRIVFSRSGPINNRYNFTMSIKDVTLEDHKYKYICRLSNKLGSTDSPKMSVLVNRKLTLLTVS